MSEVNILQLGLINQGNATASHGANADPNANFRDIWFAQVYAAYQYACVTNGRKTYQTINDGKSTVFPTIGLAGYEFIADDGTELAGLSGNVGNVQISVDTVGVSHTRLTEKQVKQANWDALSQWTRAQGFKSARVEDDNTLRQSVLAARTTVGNLSDTQPGTRIVDATLLTSAAAVIAAFENASVQLDENATPDSGRFGYIRPSIAALLRLDPNHGVTNQLWSKNPLVVGTANPPPDIGGIQLIKTPRVPHQDLSSQTAFNTAFGAANAKEYLAKYCADFSHTVGVIGSMETVGQVNLMGIESRVVPMPWRLSFLAMTYSCYGLGTVRPETAIELATA